MLRSKSIVKKTRRGAVVKVVKEQYLRDDIPCGLSECRLCGAPTHGTPLLPSAECGTVVVPDTNAFLHQMDVFEVPALRNVVVLQTVLSEVQHRDRHAYARLRRVIDAPERHFFVFSNETHRDTAIETKPGESPNDRNDRAIRVSVRWYQQHLRTHCSADMRVLLVTNDAENLDLALQAGLDAMKIHEYVRTQKHLPHLSDMLAHFCPDDSTLDGDAEVFYDEHLSEQAIEDGLRDGRLVKGVFRANADNYKEGFVQVKGECKRADVTRDNGEVLVRSLRHLNRATNNDIVAVEVLPEDQWHAPSDLILTHETAADDVDDETLEATLCLQAAGSNGDASLKKKVSGRIVGIIRRAWKPLVGYVETPSVGLTHETDVFFVPSDNRMPRVKLQTKDWEHYLHKRIVVTIDGWPRTSKTPLGHCTKELGLIGDKDTEAEAILIQTEVPHYQFPQKVLGCLPPQDFTIKPNDLINRTDLRHLLVCSIDPKGCTDIDDTLHILQLPNGNCQIGVHIADVTHFVKEDTAIDLEAQVRGNTVYLVDRRIEMLPTLLSTNLCSLRSDVDRFAFSCLWEMTQDAEVVSVSFTKSVIRSKASLSYDQAQARMDDKSLTDELTLNLRALNRIAKILRKRRMDRGALVLASPEVKFKNEDESGDPVDLEMYEMKEANALVEEYMLLANVAVAEHIYKSYPKFAMLRRHPVPDPHNFDSLVACLKDLGVTLDTRTSRTLSDSLDNAMLPQNEYFNKLVRIMTTRCMSQAVYFSSGTQPYDQFMHYGLAAPIYTHFTSPIRRYADCIVHRLLAGSIRQAPLPKCVDNQKCQKICDGINYRHRMAQAAGRLSVELHTVLFFKGRVVHDIAYVTRVKANGLHAIVPRYGIESLILTENLPNGSELRFDPKTNTLVSPTNSRVGVFDQLRVTISVDDSHVSRLQLKLVATSLVPVAEAVSLSNGLLPDGADSKRKADGAENSSQNGTKKSKK